MDKSSVSEAMAGKICRFCDTITKSYDLDTDVRDELCDHIEDRLLDYREEHKTLSEEDAFVLVREHFGDPAEVRKLLGAVHGDQAKGSFLRRLAAVFAATIAIELFFQFKNELYEVMHFIDRMIFPISRDDPSKYTMPFYPLSFLYDNMVYIALPLLLWFILARWQKRIDSGERVWFRSFKLSRIIFIVLLLLAAQSFTPLVTSVFNEGEMGQNMKEDSRIAGYSWRPSHSIHDRHIQEQGHYVIQGYVNKRLFFVASYLILQLAIWLWWCDRSRKRLQALSLAMAGWFAYSRILPYFLPHVHTRYNDVSRQFYMYFKVPIAGMISRVGSLPPHYKEFYIEQFATSLMYLFLGCCTVFVYYLMTHYRLLDTRMAQAMRLKEAK